jgi:4-diphosphocytidyl-2-C-methyl-D-erythritol kinase
MTDALTEAAPAKVNLSLHVTGKRPDGYHLLDSVVVFAGIGDVLHGRLSETLSLEITGPFAAGLADEPDNLVLRAARWLADRMGVAAGAALTLEKHLPVASGIGGGSADAAATLRLLIRLWRLDTSTAASQVVIQEVAQSLGADVPVCLHGQPVRMRGIGERLEPIPTLPEAGLLLVNPGIPLATVEVFRTRDAAFSTAPPLPTSWPHIDALASYLQSSANDLEQPARLLRPEIDDVLLAIVATDACLLARMSGSGATCFGLFPDPAAANAAAASLRGRGWWCWGGGIRSAA